MIRHHRLVVYLATKLLVALCHLGCVSVDPGECTECRLSLLYTFNSDGSDQLARLIGNIRVYIFEETSGVLVRVVDVDRQSIRRGYIDMETLPDGRYTAVAWGAGGDDVLSSFSAARMLDTAGELWTEAKVGLTHIDDFYLMLSQTSAPASGPGQMVPASGDVDDLFFALARNVVIAPGDSRVIDFEFIRNSNVLNVTVTGLEYLDRITSSSPSALASGGSIDTSIDSPASESSPLSVFVVGKNGRYRWDNTIDASAPSVRYEPSHVSFDETSIKLAIKTLHLDIERHTSDPVLLYVRDSATGRDLTSPLDIIASIRQIPSPSTRGLLYPDQSSIDRQYEFPIEVSILPDLSIRITIADWEIVRLAPVPWPRVSLSVKDDMNMQPLREALK